VSSSQSPSSHPIPTLSRARQKILATITVTAIAALRFGRLAHDAFWDNETGTALLSRSILCTSDATAGVDDAAFSPATKAPSREAGYSA
jgi:hypothetical protein